MNVKIDSSIKSPLTGEVKTDARAPKSDSAKDDSGDSTDVQLSPLAAQLQNAVQSLASSPDVFDAGRVDEIKQAISSGHFDINPEAIADKLIETARNLLTVRQ